MKLIRKTKTYIKDFFEIVIISILGLIGLIFIFTIPFEPPEERRKTIWQRMKEVILDIKSSLREVVKTT